MSMDPDGTNRIIKQQIKQWYAEIDEGRNAKLVEREPGRSPWSLLSPVRRALAALPARLASFRHRPAVTPVSVAVVAKDSKDLAKGTVTP
jgi:hypothetical protein